MTPEKLNRPNILVTNDDGVTASGIIALRDALKPLGVVTIVAPDREQSAASHAVTLRNPLRVNEIEDGVISVDGTPTDCVLLAVNGLLPERPDYLFSGINHGPNMGDDVSYSGTVAAAIEGTICGIPSVAISLAASGPCDFGPAAEFAAELARMVMKKGIPNKSLLNVNVPAVAREEITGVRITELGTRLYRDAVVKNLDPRGRSYYWIGGEKPTWAEKEGSDFNAVNENAISITPIHLDLTDYKAIVDMKKWDFDF
jgi:5'-nucleotidase